MKMKNNTEKNLFLHTEENIKKDIYKLYPRCLVKVELGVWGGLLVRESLPKKRG